MLFYLQMIKEVKKKHYSTLVLPKLIVNLFVEKTE